MFRTSFDFDIQVLIDAERNLVNSPKLLQRAMKRREPRLKKIVIPIVAVEPEGVHYPIRWTSPRQHRKVMAMLKEQGNLPYERTHELRDSWNAKFVFDADGGDFMIENISPAAPFVVGDRQQGFHADTGWINAEEVIDDRVVPLVLDDFEETFYSVADPFVRQK